MSKFDELTKQATEDNKLEGVHRYNPNNLDFLEEFVRAQVAENRYNAEVNLTVLKLYQLNPERFNIDIVCQILIKSIMALPKSDLVLAKCLLELPKKDPNADIEDQILHREPKIHNVLYLGDMIEACDFVNMWQYLSENPKLISGVAGFEEAIRQFVCHTVNITFQNIDRKLLVSLLGEINDTRLTALAKQHNWKVEKSTVFIQNHEATVKSKNIEEKLDFSYIKDILRADG